MPETIEQSVAAAPLEPLVMPLCECGCPRFQHPRDGACETDGCDCGGFALPCPMCGVPLREHLGVVGTCRKYHGTRAALMELIRASEFALKCIANEFGYSVAKANFEGLMDAIDIAKRATTLEQ